MAIPDTVRDDILSNLRALLDAVADGQITAEEAQALVADAIDDLVPTGPLDAVDDSAILAAVKVVWDAVKTIDLTRDPVKLRARADVAESKGKADRAARLRAAADRIAAREG